jgi:hypothetical protein
MIFQGGLEWTCYSTTVSRSSLEKVCLLQATILSQANHHQIEDRT